MNKTYAVVLGIVIAALGAVLLLVMLSNRSGLNGMVLYVLIALAGFAVIAVILAVFLGRGAKAAAPETAAKNRSAAIWAVIATIFAQIPFLGGWVEKTSHSPDAPIIWITVGMTAVIVALAVILITRKHAPSASGSAGTPWVVPLLVGLLVAGVAGTAVAVFTLQKEDIPTPVNFLPYVVLAIMILVFIFVLKIITVASRSSSYALPDVLPEAGPPTDARFSRGGYYDGTKMLNQRVWGIPVPVTGRGYFIRGQGKAWLANEVLAFHLYLTRKPLVIPYGIIHAVSTKNLILVKNRLPGPGMSIIWGRPDMPMVTTIQVTQNKAENEAWAQEIMYRAGAWKDKMAAAQAVVSQ
jgi:hypothetical protein